MPGWKVYLYIYIYHIYHYLYIYICIFIFPFFWGVGASWGRVGGKFVVLFFCMVGFGSAMVKRSQDAT